MQTSGCVILSNAKFDDDIKENIWEIECVEAASFTLLKNQEDKKIAIKALFSIVIFVSIMIGI